MTVSPATPLPHPDDHPDRDVVIYDGASFAVDKQGDWQGGIAEAGYRLSPSMTPRLPRDTRI